MWFLSDFASKNRSPNLEISLNSIGKTIFFSFHAILSENCFWMRIFCQFRPILVAKTYQNRVLEAPWNVLGASWGGLEGFLGRLRPSLRRHGPSWSRLRASWEPPGSVVEAQSGLAREKIATDARARKPYPSGPAPFCLCIGALD